MEHPNEQLALATPQPQPESATHGYITTRKQSQKRRAITSFEMSLEERALLNHLAATQGLGIGAVMRRSLRLYAAQHGVASATANAEVDAAA